MNNNKKVFTVILLAIAFFAACYFVWVVLKSENSQKQIACTEEAKLCPDGSYVGRVSPGCEFSACPGMQKIKLYYYNYDLGKDKNGNVTCDKSGLVSVDREIPAGGEDYIQRTVALLLEGKLTDEERARGVDTQFPLPGVYLRNFTSGTGVATLAFEDPNNQTSGGSCRVGVLWMQIEETVKQFPEIEKVRFMPEHLFQP